MRKANYDKFPSTKLTGMLVQGWDSIISMLKKKMDARKVLAVDLYTGVYKGGKTKRVNMWSAWKWLIALAVKALWWSRGEWLGKTKRLHRFTLGLHFSLVWTPFKWNALHWRWDRGDFGFVHRLFSMNLSRSLSYTKIVKRIGLCKWSGGVPDALPFFILSKLFHIDDIWYICNEINTVYYE